MSLSGAQHGYHNRLFTAVLAVKPDTDRLVMYAELGLPESRKDWTNAHFDTFKAACLAITEPDNLDAQLDGLSGDEKRCRHVIGELLRELSRPANYADAIAKEMGLRKPVSELKAPQLKKVIIALQKQRKRDPIPAEKCPF